MHIGSSNESQVAEVISQRHDASFAYTQYTRNKSILQPMKATVHTNAPQNFDGRSDASFLSKNDRQIGRVETDNAMGGLPNTEEASEYDELQSIGNTEKNSDHSFSQQH